MFGEKSSAFQLLLVPSNQLLPTGGKDDESQLSPFLNDVVIHGLPVTVE